MFALYAIPAGIGLGWLLGGRVGGLSRLEFRWAWVAFIGLMVQVVLFAEPVADRVGEIGPVIYVASTAVVLVALLLNLRIRGLPVVAAGAASNLAAIVANGGSMPASPDAMAALGRTLGETYSNSVVDPDPALPWLTDIFVLPAAVPFANVFSIGDVLIAVGIGIVIVAAMRTASVRRGNSNRGHPTPGTNGSWKGSRSSHTVPVKTKDVFR